MGEYPVVVSVHEDDAVVSAQPAPSSGFGNDAADFSVVGPVKGRGGVGEDVCRQDDASGGGGEDVSGSVRNDVLAGEPFSGSAPDALKAAVDGVETVQVTAGGKEPGGTVAVGLDGVAAEEGDGGVVHQDFALGIPVKDVLVGEPDHAVPVHGDVRGADEAAGGAVADRPGFSGRKVVEADAAGGDEPEPMPGIFRDGHGKAAQDVAGWILQLLEMQAVVHADALART